MRKRALRGPVGFAAVLAFACGGGATSDPPPGSQPADPSQTPGSQPADPSQTPGSQSADPSETPGSQAAPASSINQPSMSQGGKQSCVPCSGMYGCVGDGGAYYVSLGVTGGACVVSDGNMPVATITACNAGAASGLPVYTVTPMGLQACPEGSSMGCLQCAAVTDAGLSTTPGSGTGSGGNGACSSLSSCCNGLLAADCNAVVSSGSASACSAAMSVFCSSN